jgi:hypothetical protein
MSGSEVEPLTLDTDRLHTRDARQGFLRAPRKELQVPVYRIASPYVVPSGEGKQTQDFDTHHS